MSVTNNAGAATVGAGAKPAVRSKVDWEAVEADYRAGVMSLREIAAARSVSHVAISKRAKAHGWERDLAAKIKAKAAALVNKAEVTASVNSARLVTDRLIIEANAQRIADVQGGHKATSARTHRLGLALLAELETQSASLADLENLGELMRNADESGVDKLNDLYRKAISTPSRIDSAKKVSEMLKNAIGMEREAYGMEAKKPTESPGEITITF